ncbi:MAG: hypothetical protein EKK53_28715 [Burkholderiales bacterium]|nr:MAG: hypothetical protein EKK53_28715 [Burkholderiales bacterium]
MAGWGVRWRQPAPVCVALALAAHAAVLVGLARSNDRGAGSGAHTPGAVQARYLTEPPRALEAPVDAPSAQPAPAEAPPSMPPSPATASQAQPPAAAATVTDSTTPPVFAPNAPPALDHPDAPLPPDGVRLRVFVQVDANGMPADVVTGAPPGEPAPAPAFQKAAARALRQAQFQPGSDSTYCFLVRFEADTPAPQLAWLPSAGRDAARCLTARQPTPRDIPSAAVVP